MSGCPKLPRGMELYSFMFGDRVVNVPEYIERGTIPVPSSLLLGIEMAFVLTAVRLLLDYAVFKPLAKRILGANPAPVRKGDSVLVLDALCRTSKKMSSEEIRAASNASGLSREVVNDYMRRKREHASQAKQIGKFKEAAWRLLIYSTLVVYGINVAYGQPWFKDPSLVWDGWPAGGYPKELEMYYHFSMGVYWHFAGFQFYDTRRSDFYQMLLHHTATLFLLTFSWLVGLIRIGTLVMLAHDVSDIFMETAKLFNYAQKRFPWCHLVADGVFFVFAAVFAVSRLYIYPKYMVWNVWTAGTLTTVCRLFFCGFLTTLLILHVFWFYLILRMIYMFIFHGVEEDIRSEQGDGDGDANPSANRNSHASAKGDLKPKTA